MTHKLVAVILVNFNSSQYTLNCLESIQNSSGKIPLYIIVVDNNSNGSSVDHVKRKFPGIHLLKLKTNLGFAGGVNAGINIAMKRGAGYVWILNNDTILDKNAFSLVDAFIDPDIGGASSKIYFAPGHEYHKERYKNSDKGRVIWYAGGLIDWNNVYASNYMIDEVDNGQFTNPKDTDFLTGCSMMIPSHIIRKIGLFDEKYYLYYEDVDYSLRIQKLGMRTIYYPKSVVWHLNAASSGGPGSRLHEYYQTRNRLLFGFKYASGRTKLALSREALRMAINGTDNQRKAIIDAAFGKFGKRYE